MIEVKNNVVSAKGSTRDLLDDLTCLINALYVAGIGRVFIECAVKCGFDDSITCDKIINECHPVDKGANDE